MRLVEPGEDYRTVQLSMIFRNLTKFRFTYLRKYDRIIR